MVEQFVVAMARRRVLPASQTQVMKRVVTPELLDDDLGTRDEIASSLIDLRHINQWFGGTRTMITLLRRIACEVGTTRVSLLDVGSGNGELPLAVRCKLASEGVALDITLLDRRWTHLPDNGTAAVVADGMHLPFRDNSFDVVACTLLAHHFDRGPLQDFCAEALRVARHAVVINDLVRNRFHLGLVYAGLPLFRSRITWHDAPASARAAYTPEEMTAMLKPLPGRRIEVSRHYLFRMGVILWK